MQILSVKFEIRSALLTLQRKPPQHLNGFHDHVTEMPNQLRAYKMQANEKRDVK